MIFEAFNGLWCEMGAATSNLRLSKLWELPEPSIKAEPIYGGRSDLPPDRRTAIAPGVLLSPQKPKGAPLLGPLITIWLDCPGGGNWKSVSPSSNAAAWWCSDLWSPRCQ